ncbi:MAG TPA: ATP-binding protein [Thermoanaerobaculia bacterium]|nr:ATP-binding protein [Thermoanaerobaculia bacterium]
MPPREHTPLGELTGSLAGGDGPGDLVQALSVLAALGKAIGPVPSGARQATGFAPSINPAGALADRELRLAEARYRALVEQIPAVVFLATVEGGLNDIYVSPQIETLLGFTQEEWVGNPVLWFHQLHPDDRLPLSQEFAKTCTTGQAFRAVARVFSRGGELVWIHVEARLVRDEHGHPLFLHGIGFDVTEQQRAQETRHELLLAQKAREAAEEASRRAAFLSRLSHALSRHLDLQAIPGEVVHLVVPELADIAALGIMDRKGRLTTTAVSHRDGARTELARQLWERNSRPLLSPDDSIGLGMHDTQLVEQIDDAHLVACARNGEQLALLRRLSPRSALMVPLRGRLVVHGVLTLVASGPRSGYRGDDVTVAEDVAQRIALAIDNAQLYREAQEASRLRDEFLATLSHELRTPLNAIVGWTHILLQTTGDGAPPQVAKAAEIIGRNAQVQNQLINDILEVSTIIAGKLVLKVRPVDLPAVIEAAVDTVRPAAEAKGVTLRPILDFSAGPVSGDADRLQQVVWNLLSNAIKFTPRGGRVEVRLEAVDSQVELIVVDSGPGIDPEFLPHVFERFRQADASTTRRHGGLGLGLAIVRHLVELHGGVVRAANRDDAPGAVFTVTLPRRSVASETRQALARHAAIEDTAFEPTSLAGIHVLIVDDEADARELLATLLERCGAMVTAAASAREAFDAMQSNRYDVLLSDVGMPEEDGYSLLRRVRALPRGQGGDLPAAALTAYAGTQDRLRSLEAGFQTHLAKPVQPNEVIAVVASLARLRGAGGALPSS